MKKLLLASLVIFLANPMLGMKRELEEDTDAIYMAIHKAAIDPDKRWPEDMPTQEKLNALLIRVVREDNFWAENEASYLLNVGADPNSYDRWTDRTVLMAATDKGDSCLCKTLLHHGADLKIKDEFDQTALMRATWRRERRTYRTLITHSRFYPSRSATELKLSQDRILTALLCWKKVCPRYLPKDIRKLLLFNYLQEDALNCPTHFCKSKIHLTPPQIACKLVGQDEAVAQLKKYKFEQLAPLMIEASNEVLSHRMFNVQLHSEEFRDMLNPELLEQNFGKEIESVILADCLGNKGHTNA